MERNTFWELTDEARTEAGSVFEVAPALADLLLTLEPDEIISFAQHTKELLAESYRWDLWAVAYIVNGGSSDDGFEYFRGWLIAQGRERFLAALQDPQRIGDWAEAGACECEDILFAAENANENRTGAEFPYDDIDVPFLSEPAGAPWEEDELETLYPKLCERFF